MKTKLNLETEFNETMNSITRDFMLERCKLYKVRHSAKEDSLEILCKKYLYKLNKMEPWDIPDDEYGNAGWNNPDRILEDEAISLTLARLCNLPEQHELEGRVKERIRSYIKQVEQIELIQKIKKNSGRKK